MMEGQTGFLLRWKPLRRTLVLTAGTASLDPDGSRAPSRAQPQGLECVCEEV